MNFPFYIVYLLNAGIEQRKLELERPSFGTNVREAPNANDDSLPNAVVTRPQHALSAFFQLMINKFPTFWWHANNVGLYMRRPVWKQVRAYIEMQKVAVWLTAYYIDKDKTMLSLVWEKFHPHFDISYKLFYASNHTELWFQHLGNLLFPKTAICQEVCLCCNVNELCISEEAVLNLGYPFILFLISFSIRAPLIAGCKRHVWYFQIHLILSSSPVIRRSVIRVADKVYLITICSLMEDSSDKFSA
jgi:hypothetical protein